MRGASGFRGIFARETYCVKEKIHISHFTFQTKPHKFPKSQMQKKPADFDGLNICLECLDDFFRHLSGTKWRFAFFGDVARSMTLIQNRINRLFDGFRFRA